MDNEKQMNMADTDSRGDDNSTEAADHQSGAEVEQQEFKTDDRVENEQLDGSVSVMQPPSSEISESPTPDPYGASPVTSVQSGVSVETEDLVGSPCGDEPLTPATDNSSTSKSLPGSGRVTPASQSDQSLYLSSSEKGTPARKRKSTESSIRQIDFDNQSTSSSSIRNPRFPFRAGISWRKGERLEAMDFMHKWFPAKIREINEDEMTALIHFDGWNQRFDEWVDMSSDRIRPLIRHSERKDKAKRLKTEHKIGEQVYAKWTDCKMYPAKITAVLTNGAYEVIFYDGFKKQVQPINIRPMPGDLKSKTFEVVPSTSSVPKKRTRKPSSTVTSPDDGTSAISPPSQEAGRDSKGRSRSRSKKNKVIPMDQFVPKDVLLKDDGTDPGQAILANIQSEPVSTQTDDMETKVEVKEEPIKAELDPSPSVDVTQSVPTESLDIKPTIQAAQLQGPPVLPRKAFVVESDHNQYKCHFENCNKSFRKEHLLEYHIKYYHIDEVEALTPHPSKRRKKTISVCSSESDSTPLGRKSLGKKPRHSISETLSAHELKQDSREETDDSFLMSRWTKQVAETGDMSCQTTLVKSLDVGDDLLQASDLESLHRRTMSQDSILTEESSMTDVEEFLKPDELVNCICDYYEENGLMIQCEVCLCWQHASCFGITERTLPKTYVCFVCENPPGVRESSRYVHEQDWLKLGEIASFNYLPNPQGSEERCHAIRQTHSLVAEMHQLNSVLHSLRLQLKILRSKDEQKLKLWRMDWDVTETFSDGNTAVPTSDEAYTEEIGPESETTKEEKHDESQKVVFTLSSNDDVADCKAEGNKIEPDASTTENAVSDKQNGENEQDDSNAKVQEVSAAPETETSAADEGDKAKEVNDLKDEKAAEEQTLKSTDSGSQINAETPEGRSADVDLEEATHSDSTESVVEDPIEMYERNLLNHIQRVQTEIDERMNKIEEQVSMLESLEAANYRKDAPPLDQAMTDFPQLKKTIRILHNDLFKVKKMAVFH